MEITEGSTQLSTMRVPILMSKSISHCKTTPKLGESILTSL